MNSHKLSAVNIAFLYVGTLMGAGFASGREIWQFFGVFGDRSYFAVLLVTVLFMLFGMITVLISDAIGTTDIGRIILPFENPYIASFFGYITAAILFIVYVVMAAAGVSRQGRADRNQSDDAELVCVGGDLHFL